MDINALAVELAGEHPVTGPYDADNATAAEQLNAVNRTHNRTSMTGREVAAEIVDAEYDELSDAKKSHILSLSSGDDIDPFGFAANVVKDVFGADSDTVAALAAVRVETVSRAVELRLGTVYPGHVENARM